MYADVQRETHASHEKESMRETGWDEWVSESGGGWRLRRLALCEGQGAKRMTVEGEEGGDEGGDV